VRLLAYGLHEPDESRGSRPDLWGTGGEIPPAYPAFHVITVALSAHRGFHAELLEQFLIFGTAILAAPIRMMDETLRGMMRSYCPKKRLADEAPCHPGTEGIPDNLSVEEVFVSSAVEPAFIRSDIGDIAHPR
jgi:hypothetical protein